MIARRNEISISIISISISLVMISSNSGDIDSLQLALQNVRLDDTESNSNVSLIRGNCTTMCPKEEIEIRKQQFLVHPMEATSETAALGQRFRRCDPEKMVKCYSRPAAGKEFARIEILRPFEVLERTISYLLRLIEDSQHPWESIYDFVSDRLRAVRQDVIIQEFDCGRTMTILGKMIPFYFYAKYKCETQGCSTYDSRLHESQMDECVDRYFAAFFCEPRLDANVLRLLLLYRLKSQSTWSHMLQLPRFREMRRSFLDIFWIRRLYVQDNFVAFFRRFIKLPLLERLGLSAGVDLADFRRRSLWILQRAYGRSKIPVALVSRLLAFGDPDDVISCLKDCGLEANDAGLVDFSSKSQESENQGSRHWHRWLDDDLRGYRFH